MYRRLGRFFAAGLASALLAMACSDDPASGEPSTGDDGLPGGGGPGAPGSSADGGARGTDGEATEAGGPRCTRAAQATTAPTSLWDELVEDVSALSGSALAARIDAFVAAVDAAGGTPLQDPSSDRVVFLARGPAPVGSWHVSGSFLGWSQDTALAMAALAGTDLHFVDAKIPRGKSDEYKLLAKGEERRFLEDPLAKNLTWDGIDRGLGVRGEMNAVVHAEDAPMTQGRLRAFGKVHATKLGNDRDVWVHYPARYDDGSCRPLPTVTFHDGLESLTRGGFARVADTLYAARPELAAVLVFVGLPSQDVRLDEYTFGDPTSKAPGYVDFLTADLWPALRAKHRLCGLPGARGISGASLGGLVSTFAAFEQPSTWGWVGAQSPSYWWKDSALIARASESTKIPVRFYLDSGCPVDNCEATDQMAAVFVQKGYEHVRIKEAGAAHDWSFWRGRLAGMLTHFRENRTDCD